MATLDMQNTAQLAESRRKMQSKRRIKNRIALTLSMATMAFGLFWLIWILMSTSPVVLVECPWRCSPR